MKEINRILILDSTKSPNGPLYRFLRNEEGEIAEFADDSELDEKVEELLIDYAKSNVIPVREIDYTIDADIAAPESI